MQTFKKEFIEAAKLFVNKKDKHGYDKVLIQFNWNDLFIVAGDGRRLIAMRQYYVSQVEHHANYSVDIDTLLACQKFEIDSEGHLLIGEKSYTRDERALLRHWKQVLHSEAKNENNKEVYDHEFLLAFQKASKIIHGDKNKRYVKVKNGIVDLEHEKVVGVVAGVRWLKETFKISAWM